jgi:hypothetical protein
MKEKILILLLLLLFSANLYAVDRYKSLKFGMTEKEALQTGICTFRQEEDISFMEFSITDVKRFKMFTCEDLAFAQRKIRLSVELIDGFLHRVIIDPSYSIPFHKILLEDLKRKYGFENEHEELKTRSILYIFDDKMVEAEVFDPPANNMYVRYKSPQYERLLVEDPKKGKLRDDI